MKTYDIINAGPNNRFMANGRIVSNSGRGLQLQNLARNSLETLDIARSFLREGNLEALELIYGNVPEVLSQLVRTMFIPKPGCRFIVADFSAIEARALAWVSQEEWRLEAFRNGEDIYCASASAMTGLPVEKHGVNSHLRQKGKIAELACIAEGQPVLTNAGLVPIEYVTKAMKVWDGEEWVSHDGVIYRGEREVITYDGLTATPDHLVFVEGQSEPEEFGVAATCGAHLLQTGDGGRAVRLGEDYQPGETLGEELEQALCPDGMPGVRVNTVAESEQPEKREVQGLSEMFSAEADTSLVRSETDCSEAEVREPVRTGIQELRCARDKVQFSECNDCRYIPHLRFWIAGEGDGDRQDRHEWGLCTRKPSLCGSQDKLCKSTEECSEQIRAEILAVQLSSSNPETVSGAIQRGDHSRCGEGGCREKEKLAIDKGKARVYDIRNAGRHHRFTVSGHLVHNCGYGGGVGALTSMGALDMGLTEDELPSLIKDWRNANPNITKFWWDVDKAATKAFETGREQWVANICIGCFDNKLQIKLPSGRILYYVNPGRIMNQFGQLNLAYDGVGQNKKWSRIPTYGPKLVENCIGEGTLVITSQGLTPIEHITDDMLIWDGENWVSHEGLIYQGVQETVSVNGIHMTPDHKILTEEGWKRSAESSGLDWASTALPNNRDYVYGDVHGPCRVTIGEGREYVDVYDIRNCGPRHRFAVWNGERALIVSNCIQGICRDILADAMLRVEAAGYDIVAHVHDEIICEVPIGVSSVDEICSLMSQLPDWADNTLPLNADGYECEYYKKD